MAAKRKPSKRTTTKRVQSTEDVSPKGLPTTASLPDIDEDAWGKDGLTGKQRLFVQYYLGEAAGNGTKAARLAGYRDDNNHSLAATASENLRKPNIQRALEREIGRRFGSPDDVKSSIAAIANGNAADYLKADEKTGKLVPDLDKLAESGGLGLLHEIREEGIESDGSLTVIKRKIKLYDRLRALELLAKINGQLIERKDITSNGETLKGYAVISPDDWDSPKPEDADTNPSAEG